MREVKAQTVELLKIVTVIIYFALNNLLKRCIDWRWEYDVAVFQSQLFAIICIFHTSLIIHLLHLVSGTKYSLERETDRLYRIT